MAKPMQFSISSLLALILICAVGLIVWKNQPMDHFELAVAGELVAKLPEGTQLKIFRNPDYKRSLQNLPTESDGFADEDFEPVA